VLFFVSFGEPKGGEFAVDQIKLIYIVLGSAAILTIAYFTYGPLLARLFRLNDKQPTPAVELRDNLDYEPLAPVSLLPQHFSAIAAAGPIVGPIMAGLLFGWLPALIWILVGSIFIGGVHDFSSLVASIRHKARTIAEVVRENMSPLSYLLFLTFIWLALVYIIVAFTDVTADAFIGPPSEERGGVGGGAIASSSVLYLLITMLFGLVMRFTKMPLWASTAVFLVLVGGAIVAGKYIPFDVTERFVQVDPESDAAVALANSKSIADSYEREIKLASDSPTYPAGQLETLKTDLVTAREKQATDQALVTRIQYAQSRKIWDVVLLLYCLVAAVLPVWLLLQPARSLGRLLFIFRLGSWRAGADLRRQYGRIPSVSRLLGNQRGRRSQTPLSTAVYYYCVWRLQRFPFAYFQRHDFQATAQRKRR
jgi:carbon starvation protein CstA